MGRVINVERAGQEREQLIRSIVLAVRELSQKTEIDLETKDLAAYISIALLAIWEGIESSVTPWEKRGYWIKADRFRMEWAWSQKLGMDMKRAVLSEDWSKVALLTGQVAGKLTNVKLPLRHRIGTPWKGALKHIIDQSSLP